MLNSVIERTVKMSKSKKELIKEIEELKQDKLYLGSRIPSIHETYQSRIAELRNKLTDFKLECDILKALFSNVICEWKLSKCSGDGYELYHTDCGHTFLYKLSVGDSDYYGLDGGGYTYFFCPYCGKRVYVNRKKGDDANVDSDKG